MELRTVCLLSAFAITVTLAGFVASSRAASVDEEASRGGWEYLVVAGGTTNLRPPGSSSLRKEASAGFERESFVVEQNMDKLGAKGWELVAVLGSPTDPVYYFKRPR